MPLNIFRFEAKEQEKICAAQFKVGRIFERNFLWL